MKALFTLIIVVILAAIVTTAGIEEKRTSATDISVPNAQTEIRTPDNSSGGMGMTYGGKVGIELAPGLVMDFDGNVSPGFGF